MTRQTFLEYCKIFGTIGVIGLMPTTYYKQYFRHKEDSLYRQNYLLPRNWGRMIKPSSKKLHYRCKITGKLNPILSKVLYLNDVAAISTFTDNKKGDVSTRVNTLVYICANPKGFNLKNNSEVFEVYDKSNTYSIKDLWREYHDIPLLRCSESCLVDINYIDYTFDYSQAHEFISCFIRFEEVGKVIESPHQLKGLRMLNNGLKGGTGKFSKSSFNFWYRLKSIKQLIESDKEKTRKIMEARYKYYKTKIEIVNSGNFSCKA